MPKFKAAGLPGFVTAARRLPGEVSAAPSPLPTPAPSPCAPLPVAPWEPSGPLLPLPPVGMDDRHTPRPSALGVGTTGGGWPAVPLTPALTRDERGAVGVWGGRELFVLLAHKHLLSTH